MSAGEMLPAASSGRLRSRSRAARSACALACSTAKRYAAGSSEAMVWPARTDCPSSGPTLTTFPGTSNATSTVVFACTMPLAVVDHARDESATACAMTGTAVLSAFARRAGGGAYAGGCGERR